MNSERLPSAPRILISLGLAAIVAMVAAATPVSAASSVAFQWGTQTNESAPGQYNIRGLAIDQTNGSIYVAQAAAQSAQATPGVVVKLNSAGTILWTKGPDLLDGSNVIRATIPLHSPAGIAVDPLTGNVYVLIQEGDTTTSVHVLDSNGIWLKKFATGLPPFTVDAGSAYGGAFSDDGQKYLIAGLLEKLPGGVSDSTPLGEDPRGSKYGGKLFTRNNQGTPGDFSDDTWEAAAELLETGEFWMGYHFPRATGFDRLGRIYVGDSVENNTNNYWHSSYVRSYDSTAPYALKRAIITGGAQWAIDTDGSNNVWTTWSRERTSGNPRYVRCTSPEGIRLLAFLPSANGGAIIEPMYCAFDRANNRIVVGGQTVVGASSTITKVESFQPTLETPTNLRTVTGTVVDSDDIPIPNANVGYRATAGTDFPANVNQVGFGYWERGRADANGEFSFVVADTFRILNPGEENEQYVSFPVVPTASAPGYLTKRVHVYQIGDPARPDQFGNQTPSEGTIEKPLPNIKLDDATAESVTIRLYGKEGIFDPPEEESGLFWLFRSSSTAASAAVGGEPAALLGSVYSGVQGWLSRFLNLNVDDRWMYDGSPFDKVYVTVEYFGDSVLTPGPGDFGTPDSIALEADVQGNMDMDRHAPVGEHLKTIIQEDPQWESVTFPVENAKFANRQLRGGDLRVNSVPPPTTDGTYVSGSSRDWVRRVTISQTAPEGHPLVADAAAAKAQGSGAVAIEGQVISAQWNGDEFYLQQPDRAAAINVKLADGFTGSMLTAPLSSMVGRYGHVQGTIQTLPTGEPQIVANVFGASSDAGGPAALGMNGRDAVAEFGLDPTALKVGVWGLVTSVAAESFTIDDGSGDITVIVGPSTGISLPISGDYVTVTGIATLEGFSPETAVRVIRPWTASDVVVADSAPAN